MAATLGTLNPFRYRGYVYDEETGLYYLRSRYYNPVWGRFINADSVLGKPGQLLGHNIFAYCKNSPIDLSDESGNTAVAVATGAFGVLKGLSLFFAAILGLEIGEALDSASNNNAVASSSSSDIVIARPTTVAQTATKELADVEASDEMTGALYYMAWINRNDGYLHRSSQGMHYFEAAQYLTFITIASPIKKLYGQYTIWGVYTQYQPDAKLLAITFGNTDVPEIHGIGYFGYYHDEKHKIHIWFGMPLE